MKKKLILSTATAAIAALTLTSYSGGPAGNGLNQTGSAANSNGSCAGSGCHSSNTTNTSASLLMTDDAAPTAVVTSYVPGHTYTVTLAGQNTSASLPKFGFQVACVRSSSTTTNAGSLVASASGTAMRTVSNVRIVEHTSALPAVSSSGNSNTYLVQFKWTAPNPGTGNVKFFAMLNAVNGNGAVSGDQPNAVIKEVPQSTTGIGSIANSISLSAYPSPVAGSLQLEIRESGSHTYLAGIYDMSGRLLQQTTVTGQKTSIDVSSLSAGHYTVSVVGEQGRGSVRFVKQ